jgi:hypothetical protein
VDKLLTLYMARDVTLPSLIRAEWGFKDFTAENVLGRIETHHDQLKRVKINQDLAYLQEQAAKNNGLVLQAKSKGKEKATQSSKNDESSDNEDDELDDKQMALFIKNFRRVLKKSNFRSYGKNKNKYEPRKRSMSVVLVARKLGISLQIARKIKRRARTPRRAHPRKKSQGTTSTPVKLTLANNGIQMKRATPTMKMLQPWHSRHLRLILQAF